MVSWGLHVKNVSVYIWIKLWVRQVLPSLRIFAPLEKFEAPLNLLRCRLIRSYNFSANEFEQHIGLTKSVVGERNKSPISHSHNQLDALVRQQAAVGSISTGWMRFFTSFWSNFEWQRGSACHRSYLLTWVSPWDLLHCKLLRFGECHQHKEGRPR